MTERSPSPAAVAAADRGRGRRRGPGHARGQRHRSGAAQGEARGGDQRAPRPAPPGRADPHLQRRAPDGRCLARPDRAAWPPTSRARGGGCSSSAARPTARARCARPSGRPRRARRPRRRGGRRHAGPGHRRRAAARPNGSRSSPSEPAATRCSCASWSRSCSTGADPDALPRSVEGGDHHAHRPAVLARTATRCGRPRCSAWRSRCRCCDEVLAADWRRRPGDADPLARLGEFLEPVGSRPLPLHPPARPRRSPTRGCPTAGGRSCTRRTAAAIERVAGEQADRHAELLSMHCFHGGRFAAAYAYARLAAQRARARYANAEAAESYRRALAAAARLAESPTRSCWPRSRRRSAEIYVERGEMHAADLTLRRALRRVGDAPAQLARLQLKVAGLRETEARFRAASGGPIRPSARSPASTAPRSASSAASWPSRRARLNYRRARYDEAMAFANVAIALVRRPTTAPRSPRRWSTPTCARSSSGCRRAGAPSRRWRSTRSCGDLAAQARVAEHAGDARLPPRRLAEGAGALRGLRAGRHPLRKAVERRDAGRQPGGDPRRSGPAGGGAAGARAGDADLARRQRRVDDRLRRVPARPDRGAPAARPGRRCACFDASRQHFSELGELTEVVVVDALRAEALSLAGDPEAALALADADARAGPDARRRQRDDAPAASRTRGRRCRSWGGRRRPSAPCARPSTRRAAASRATRSPSRSRRSSTARWPTTRPRRSEWRAELAQLSERAGDRSPAAVEPAGAGPDSRAGVTGSEHPSDPPVISAEDQPCALGSLAVVVNDSVYVDGVCRNPACTSPTCPAVRRRS